MFRVMRTVFWFIYALMLLVTVVVTGIFVFSETFVSIQENERYYIQTWFREGRFYTEGYYFFPEKLLERFSLDTFKMSNVPKHKLPIIIDKEDLSIELPHAPELEEKSISIRYTFKCKYIISPEDQLRFAKEAFPEYQAIISQEAIKLSRQYLESFLIDALNTGKNINISSIFEAVKQEIIGDLETRYKKRIRITAIHHKILNAPRWQTYTERRRLITEMQEELLKDKIATKHAHEKEKTRLTHEFKRLRAYGKLLREFPEVLHLLYIEKLSDKIIASEGLIIKPADISTRVTQIQKQNTDSQATQTPKTEPSEETQSTPLESE